MKNDNSWLKLYRKIGEHEILFDDKALRLFIWLLTHCDRETGEMSVSKHWTAQAVKLKPSTFYDALKRLQNRYKIVALTSTKRYTKVRLLNWAKYQSTDQPPTTKPTNDQTFTDTLTRRENKNIYPSDILEGQPQEPPAVEKPVKKLSENQLKQKRILDFYQSWRQTNIANYGKSLKAISLMFKAGYTPEQIEWTIKQIAADDYYIDKTWDLMTVADKIPTYKAKVRREMNHV